MKSLRSRQPSVRTHGLRRIGKVFVPKPKPERVWNVHTDWEEPWSRSQTVKCLHCREVVRAVDERCPYCHGDTSDFADFSVLT